MQAVSMLVAFVLCGTPEEEVVPNVLPDDQTRQAVQRALVFLEEGAASWREKRKCVTCHRVAMNLWAQSDAKAMGLSVNEDKLKELTDWSLEFCATDKNDEVPTGGFLHTMNQMILSQQNARKDNRAIETFEVLVPIFARMQREDGSWKEGNQIKFEEAQREADEVDTMWTLLALNSLARIGESLKEETRASVDIMQKKALTWLETSKQESRTDWIALRMLVSQAYKEAPEVDRLRQELLARQNQDGGWPFVRGGASHVHVTGESVYALRPPGFRWKIQRLVVHATFC